MAEEKKTLEEENESLRSYVSNIVLPLFHEIWENNKEIYKDGYAIFYSHVYKYPNLMLIGDNPGGDITSFSGKETLNPEGQPMEYITYRDDPKYKIAGKTVKLFESIEELDILRASVKTNRNFFRSVNLQKLPGNHSRICKTYLEMIIELVSPRIIFCESLGTLDFIKRFMISKNIELTQLNFYSTNKRIYDSYKTNKKYPQLIIGIHHLTSSRSHLTNEEYESIKPLLKKDISLL